MSTLGTIDRPLYVAVIGSGPSGFYAIDTLFKSKDHTIRVDLFDRLPTPYGLVRGGVAPDHQKIKHITKIFDRIATKPNFRFLGNVKLGVDISVDELKEHYDAIIYAVGCEGARDLGIPGEDLDGVHSATEFVFWYNAHPDYQDRCFRLEDAHRVAVVGNGNVAVDVARVLVRNRDELAQTDISDDTLTALRSSPLTEVITLGRRGPAQAAFSPKELRELTDLSDVDVIVPPDAVHLQDVSQAWLDSGDAPKSAHANYQLLKDQAALGHTSNPRKIRTWFRVSPVEFIGTDGKLTHIRLRRNRLVVKDGHIRVEGTDETWLEEVQLVFKAIGYRGVKIPNVPFEEWGGTIPNQDGRVIDPDSGQVRMGEYVVGWAKRGPSGLIGSNKPDSKHTIKALLTDLSTLSGAPSAGDGVHDLLAERGVYVVSFADWQRLNAAELQAGVTKHRVRQKFTRIDDMLAVLRSEQGAQRGGDA